MLFRIRFMILFSLFFALHSPAQAQTVTQEKFLVDILSEPESNLHHQLFLDLNESGDIEEFSRVSVKSSQTFTLADILDAEVVLARTSGIDAVLLSCLQCDAAVGGNLVLKYVYNGLTKSYRTFEMRLVRNENDWLLTTKDGIEIRSLTLKNRKILGVTVGVNDIRVNEYEPETSTEM